MVFSMKKINYYFVTLFLILLFCSCSNTIVIQDRQNTIDNDRKMELVQYHITDDYKVSSEEMMTDLQNFLEYSDDASPVARSSVNSASKTTYSFTPIISKSVDLSKCKDTSINSKEIKASDNVTFSIVDVTSSDGESGYAIMTDDKRLGTLLAYSEGTSFQEDISDDSFSNFIATSIDNYLSETKDMWDNIDENDYEALKKYYGITDAQIEEARKSQGDTPQAKAMFGVNYSSWSRPKQVGPLLKTDWDQFVYNKLIDEMRGKEENYPVGCGPLAAAQIMAYHKYPNKTTLSTYNVKELSEKYSVSKGWNGEYNWEEILNNSEIGIRDASCLLYEIGKLSITKYGYESSAWTPFLIDAMDNMGYETPHELYPTSNYSFDAVRKSLDKNCPVFVEGFTGGRYVGLPFWKWIEWGEGQGHAFVCDGYLYQERKKTTYVFWIPFRSTEKNEFVHLNPGWGGLAKGWYKSGIFDMNNGFTTDEEVSNVQKRGTTSNNKDYSRVVRIWTNIRPKENV